jgi:hypothetical protein
MKAYSFEAALRETIAPPPDPHARLRARRAACEKFVLVHALRIPRAPYRSFSLGRPMIGNVLAGGAAACMMALTLVPLCYPTSRDVERWRYGNVAVVQVTELPPPAFERATGPAPGRRVGPNGRESFPHS